MSIKHISIRNTFCLVIISLLCRKCYKFSIWWINVQFACLKYFVLFAAWPRLVISMLDKWTHFHRYWLHHFPGELLVVRYEDLKDHLSLHLPRVLKFLNVTVSDKTLNCALHSSEGSYHRPHGEDDNKRNVFSEDMIGYMNEAIDSLDYNNSRLSSWSINFFYSAYIFSGPTKPYELNLNRFLFIELIF